MMALLLLGCATTELYQVEITGEVTSDQDGPITVLFQFAWWGEGELATPLQTIDTIELEGPGDFAHTFEYLSEQGEGLVVYGWQDLDGDGELCAPGVDDEPVGLVEVADFPSHEVSIVLPLDVLCEGPEGLFP